MAWIRAKLKAAIKLETAENYQSQIDQANQYLAKAAQVWQGVYPVFKRQIQEVYLKEQDPINIIVQKGNEPYYFCLDSITINAPVVDNTSNFHHPSPF